jgi:hypothetical protein
LGLVVPGIGVVGEVVAGCDDAAFPTGSTAVGIMGF